MLNKRGYRVLAAAGGAEALHILRSETNAVDLLITDIIMPRMGGKELAEQARKLRPDLPILFVSGYTEGTIRQDDLSPGTAFLHKPFTPDDLSKQIRLMLQERQN
jgi:CheY-like chemotaxis protein